MTDFVSNRGRGQRRQYTAQFSQTLQAPDIRISRMRASPLIARQSMAVIWPKINRATLLFRVPTMRFSL
jgi:hypothetical protein